MLNVFVDATPLSCKLWQRICRRPLLVLAPLVASGCGLGLGMAGITARSMPGLDWWLRATAAALVVLMALGMRASRARANWSALGVAATVLLALIACTAARRMRPPLHDIAWLVRSRPVANGPQVPLSVVLHGQVAGPRRSSDFSDEFPLEVSWLEIGGHRRRAEGTVAILAPPGSKVAAGDSVTMRVALIDLPRIDNSGQRDVTSRDILQNCWCRARVAKLHDIHIERSAKVNWLTRAIAGFGGSITNRFETAFTRAGFAYPHALSQLLAAMTFGEGTLTEPLPATTRQAFLAAGLTHLLVASGTQISCILAILLGAGKLIGARRWLLAALVLPLLVLFALISGSSSSIWRAVVGGACLTWALVAGRDADALSLWSLALIVLLLIDPLQAHDIGFQLTFGATWGLIALTPLLMRWLPQLKLDHPLGHAAVVSLAAQLATAPILMVHFGRLSLAGLAANAVAVPMASLLVGSGLCGLVIAPVNRLNYLLTSGVAGTAFQAAQVDGAGMQTMPLASSTLIFIYAPLLAAAISPGLLHDLRAFLHSELEVWRRHRRSGGGSRRTLLPWMVAGAVLLATAAARTLWSAAHPQIMVALLDVGQGESIVIRGPGGSTAIIDGGSSDDEGRGDVGRAVIVPYLQSIGVRRINAMFVTHADSDHCNGLKAVLRELPVDMAVDGAAAVTSQTYANEPDYLELRDAWRRHGVKVVAARAGIGFDLGGGAILTMLAPKTPPLEGDNNNCEVLRLDYGATSWLFTADIEAPAENRLLQDGTNLHCTVLQVAHHGSQTSSSAQFLRAAHPSIAVISCGRYNKFGHPAPQTLERLARCGAATFRTDRDGAIEVRSDGLRSWVETVH